MRVNVFVGGPALKTALVAAAFGGVIAASCSFNPAPAGSATGQNTGYGGSGVLGVAASTGTTGGAGSSSSGAAGSGSGPGTPSPDGKNCGAVQVGLENVPPDLLIVLDKSGSMAHDESDGTCGAGCTSKWTSTTTAINMVVAQTETNIRWGLKYFSTDGNCGVANGAAVPIAPNNAKAISDSIATSTPKGNTPTAAGVTSGVKYLQGLTDTNPKYILLATDGEPNCANGSTKSDRAGAVAAVTAAEKAGFPVYVVGVGNVMTAQDTLNMLATAGGRPQMGTPSYYPVASTDELVAVLTKIGGQIASCTFSLPSVPPVPMNVGVYADGDVKKKIPQDTTHMNGWDYGAGMRSIELFGTACDNVKNKVYANVQAIFGCPGMVIP